MSILRRNGRMPKLFPKLFRAFLSSLEHFATIDHHIVDVGIAIDHDRATLSFSKCIAEILLLIELCTETRPSLKSENTRP